MDNPRLGVLALVVPLFTALAATGDAQTFPVKLQVIKEAVIDAVAMDLSPIGAVLVTKGGEIAVTQPTDHNVRFFSSTGAPSGVFGTRGAGPGEFRSFGASGYLGDTLWVADYQNNRLTYVSPTHRLLRSEVLVTRILPAVNRGVESPQLGLLYLLAVISGGSTLVSGSTPHGAVHQGDNASRTGTSARPIVQLDRDGRFVRVSGWQELRECSVPYPAGRGQGQVQIPFCLQLPLGVSTDGSWLGFASQISSTTLRLTVTSSIGDTIFSRKINAIGAPIPKSKLDSVITARSAIMPPEAERALKGADLPKRYPAFRRILIGMDGTIWLESWTDGQEHSWRILDRTGKEIATLELPRDTELRQASREKIWCVMSDPDGLESVIRFRVSWPG